MSVAEELDKLKRLHADGTITDEQYEQARARLLEKQREGGGAEEPPVADLAEPEDAPEERRSRRYRDRADYDDDEEDEYDRRLRRRRKKEVREWCMILHLSLFAGHTVPLGGIIAPIVIWQVKKEEMPEIDEHGRNALNWIISNILYVILCIPLCFILVGFALLIALAVLNVVFPVIAALKANEGRVWKYPLAIPFLR